MRIVCISDTHNQLGRFSIPEGDVLIHAGDLTQRGTSAEIFDQFDLLAAMPHQTIIFTPGNHDWGFQTQRGLREAVAAKFSCVTILIDESVMIGGMRLYASPFQPYFNNWAFQFAAGPEGRAGGAALISHSAPAPRTVKLSSLLCLLTIAPPCLMTTSVSDVVECHSPFISNSQEAERLAGLENRANYRSCE